MKHLGKFNYLSDESESSLYANGKVLTRRNILGSDYDYIGIDKKYEIGVLDVRELKNFGTNYFNKKDLN